MDEYVIVKCKILLLDNEIMEVKVDENFEGYVLMDKVCEELSLIDRNYFSLTYAKDGKCLWVNMEEKLSEQLPESSDSEWSFEFRVKIYPEDPLAFEDEVTRYLLCLQLRKDISSKRLSCPFETHALLCSYAVQSDYGDYNPETADGFNYLKEYNDYKSQTDEFLQKMVDFHKSHIGQTPVEADKHFLENVRELPMYGKESDDVLDS